MEEIFSVYECKDCGNENANELDFDKTTKHVVCISCQARRSNKPKVDFYVYEKIEAAKKKKTEDKKREEVTAAELDKIAETYKADWYGIAHYPED